MASNKLKMLMQGEKFNRLTTVRFDHKDSRSRRYYLFSCECGVEKVIHGTAVSSGNTKSCGCWGMENRRSHLLANNRGVINQIILGYKRHANGRNLTFELTYEEFSKVIVEPCYYCGSELSNLKITKNCKEGFKYNGIDRIDSSVGYREDNVVACCSMCNTAKSNLSQQEFLQWVNKIYNFQNGSSME